MPDEVVLTSENAQDLALAEYKQEQLEKDPDWEKKSKLAEVVVDEEPTVDKDKKEDDPIVNEDDKEKKVLTDEDILVADEETLSDDQKAKRTELVATQTKYHAKLMDTKEEELTDDEKKDKDQLILAKEAEKIEEFESEVKAYAEENKISVEEARKEVDVISDVEKKYDKNLRKTAKAYIHSQKEYYKKEDEIKALKEKMNQPQIPSTVAAWEEQIKEHGLTNNGQVIPVETIIVKYREANEDLSAEMSDAQILKQVAKDINSKVGVFKKEQELKVKEVATDKRTEFLSKLPKEVDRWKEKIKDRISKISDSSIINPSFSMQEVVDWAKGTTFDEELKKAKEEGIALGKASAGKKIITGPISRGSNTGASKGAVSTLTEAQKTEAREQYPSLSDEDAFNNYKEVYEHRIKNKKKKIKE